MSTPLVILLAALQARAASPCDQARSAARDAFGQARYAAAGPLFEEALRTCPPDPALRLAYGQMLVVAGKQVDAEREMKAALAIDPAHGPTLYALGRLYYEQHRYAESAERLEQVVKADPAHHRAWDNLGLTYDALRRDSDALRAFFRALDLVMNSHPDYDWAHANLADFFLKREQHEKAFQLAAEAARRNPKSARNAFLTGKALVKLDKPELSLRWLERATELDATYSEAWYLRAQACRKLGRTADAGAALARFKALKQAP